MHCVPCFFSVCYAISSYTQIRPKRNLLPHIAWYDSDLKIYQKDRQEGGGELLKRFEDRSAQPASAVEVAGDFIRKKSTLETETEWQKQVKNKKSDDYYKNIKEVSKFSLT